MLDTLMQNWRRIALLLAVAVAATGLAACSGDDGLPVSPDSAGVSPERIAPEWITIGISMYLLVDDLENPDPTLSSHRTEEELTGILAGMNEIWSQANVRLEMKEVTTLVVPREILAEVAAGNIRAFFNPLGDGIPFSETGLISGFYARRIGGPNGITLLGSRRFMVMDEPTVFDRRVSAHEVGHILGLGHTLSDRDRLLFPGANGMSLTPEEITLTRYVAAELLKARE